MSDEPNEELIEVERPPILIVDDEPSVCEMLAYALSRRNYACEVAYSAPAALTRLAARPFAVVLADIWMPDVSGMELLQQIHAAYPSVAVIITTGLGDRETVVAALRLGAYDFLAKPLNLDEVGFSVQRALEKRQLALEVQAYQRELERKVEARTLELHAKNLELQQMLLNVIESIAVALESRDEYTAHHSYRVRELATRLARRVGLPETDVERVRQAALLHDIGKIGIRESVLHKEGRLTEEEMEHIKTHPLVAEQILRPLRQLEDVITIIKHEHEAYDGSGYPEGLSGAEVPLEARIIAVADVYDALTSDRPYRSSLPHEMALRILRKGAGSKWDPDLVALFVQMMEEEPPTSVP